MLSILNGQYNWMFLMLYVLALFGIAASCFVYDSSSPEHEDNGSGDGSSSDEQDVHGPVAPLNELIEPTESVMDAGVAESDCEPSPELDVITPKSDTDLSDDDLIDEFDELIQAYDSECSEEQKSNAENASTLEVGINVDPSDVAAINPDLIDEGSFDDSDPAPGEPNLAGVTTIVGTATNDTLTGVDVQFEVGSEIAKLQGDSPDTIYGDDGNDTIFIGGNDVAYGGNGSDTFVIDGELEADNIPIVEDFDTENDTIEISIPSPEDELESSFPERPSFEGSVCIVHENENTYVKLNGELVCMLRGLHDFDETSVRVKYDHYAGLKTDFDLQYGY